MFDKGVVKLRVLYKVFGIVTSTVTWFVALCTLVAILVLYVPGFFGIEPYIVLSGSMEPVIHTGSLVYVSDVDTTPQIGDIVAYRANDNVAVIHRIVDYGDNGYITQGDSNDTADMNEVLPSQIIGQYVKTIPNAGYLLSEIQSHVVYFGALSIPAIIPMAVGLVLLLNVVQYIIGIFIPDE